MGIHRVSPFGIVGLLFLGNAVHVMGDPRIFQATGSKPEDLQPVIDQFRQAVSGGGGYNGSIPRMMPNGYREVSWEEGTALAHVSGLYVPNKGLLLGGGPTAQFAIGATALGPNDPNGALGNLNPAYRTIFQPYSSSHVLGFIDPLGVTFGINFVPPAPAPDFTTDLARGTLGFGAVFTDVDLPDTTLIALHGYGKYLGTFSVPANPGDGNLSFLGIAFDQSEDTITWAEIKTGNKALVRAGNDGDPDSQLGVLDFVAMDDFIFGEPRPIPEPSPISIVSFTLCEAVGMRSIRRLNPSRRYRLFIH